jgi:hypothetical protein
MLEDKRAGQCDKLAQLNAVLQQKNEPLEARQMLIWAICCTHGVLKPCILLHSVARRCIYPVFIANSIRESVRMDWIQIY